MDIVYQLNKFMEKNSGNYKTLEKTIQDFDERRSSFRSLDNYLKELSKIIRTRSEAKLKKFFQTYRQNSINKYKKIYQNSKPLLENKKRIVTISNSRTVLEFLKLWHRDNKNIEVIIPESRPMNEGHEMAKSLLKKGIKVLFITDFNISNYISKSDAVIVGADSILKNGDSVNKTGSRAAAVISKYYRKPFYVLAGSDKFSKKNSYKTRMEDPAEVWDYKKNKLKIINNYFEVIEKKLITKIISEER